MRVKERERKRERERDRERERREDTNSIGESGAEDKLGSVDSRTELRSRFTN